MDGPPPIPPRPPGYELPSPPAAGPPPPLPPRQPSGDYTQYSSAPPPPPPPRPQQEPTGWSHLLYENGDPTPLFTSLMNDFFTVLDPQNTGRLTPEVFSGFLALNCFTHDEDPWRKNYRPLAPPWEPVDNADFELKAAYEAWYFAHEVRQRSSRPRLPHGGMPLLLREGFLAYLAVEFSDDAPARCRGLNAALQRYGAHMGPGPDGRGWLALGPAPQWIFSQAMPPQVRRRVDEANARSRRMAAERIEAVRVEHALRAQGRRNAEELTGDYRYVWREY
ncbi:hypothetical protein CONLIGDRAFT_440747 [Coniochaeta ligniaria NRRL 30616]|uniref:EF-hand domain-containing protein n=1 Tax=Coniochaeta ligniaria NRRL 30616 TaxID=1408157 RepID=A0A1J7IJW8_9PEZI|nr:hypothetical protein CONLIGDRAFT_440747 [Coniochaeta ligniaria NRRL 30616]